MNKWRGMTSEIIKNDDRTLYLGVASCDVYNKLGGADGVLWNIRPRTFDQFLRSEAGPMHYLREVVTNAIKQVEAKGVLDEATTVAIARMRRFLAKLDEDKSI